jgi:tetratricopeptide (TPR) repeat protein
MMDTPDSEITKNIELAWKKFEKKDFKGAVKLFQEVYEEHDDREGLYGYACSLLRNGEAELATEMFDKLVDAEKNNFKAYHMRALSNGADENYEGAIKDLEKVIELAVEKHEAWCDLGGTYMAMKDYKRAAQCFQKAVDVDGTCHEAWMGKALAAYFNKEQKAALEFLNITLKLNPKNLLALLAKAELLIEMGKGSEVEKELKKILAIDPNIFKKSAKEKETDEEEEADDYDVDEDANRSDDDEIEEFDLDD